jgi:SM-20-related protein
LSLQCSAIKNTPSAVIPNWINFISTSRLTGCQLNQYTADRNNKQIPIQIGPCYTDTMLNIFHHYWNKDERAYLRNKMEEASWISMQDLPAVKAMFPSSNWLIADIAPNEVHYLRSRLDQTVGYGTEYDLGITYFQYSVGDRLEPHTDEYNSDAEGVYGKDGIRKVAIIGYLHDHWEMSWGGELIVGDRAYPPQPGTLVWFDVPLLHEVLPVTPFAKNARLSISGWYIEKQNPSEEGPARQ